MIPFLAVGILLGSCKSTSTSLHEKKVLPPVENAITIESPKTSLSEDVKKHWAHKDIKNDSVAGISLAKAYEFLKGKKHVPVIVGINDSGLDMEHEDLKEVIWVNPKEIPDNDKDDDGNGYVDDVHGWNFLGDMYDENLEVTRLLKVAKKRFDGKSKEDIKPEEQKDYDAYLKMKDEVKSGYDDAKRQAGMMPMYLKMANNTKDLLVKALGTIDFTLEDLTNLKADSPDLERAKMMVISMMKQGTTLKAEIENLKGGVAYFEGRLKQYDLDFNPRKDILKNDANVWDKGYGNNNPGVYGKDELHGTHVAGIVAANRANDGAMGVYDEAIIMPVRTVPNGDEYDKDVALSIRYAVDNGAKVINTSFGKGYSPKSDWVYDAIRYAASKDVLIVNAAGNDSKDIDKAVNESFPTDAPDLMNEIADNMITIGAITFQYNENLVSGFSNYGKVNVDLFAPGSAIYSTVPHKDKYRYLQGTSMAAPMVAGVAALIRAYYPGLSASQVKHILMNSGQKIPFKVKKPDTKELVSFDELCVSGRILNAYNAVMMADAMTK